MEDLWEDIADEVAAEMDSQGGQIIEDEVPMDDRQAVPHFRVERMLQHLYKHRWRFLVVWGRHSIAEATWEMLRSFAAHKDITNQLEQKWTERESEGGSEDK